MVHKTVVFEEEIEGKKAAEFDSRLAEELMAYRQETTQELEEYRAQMENSFQVSYLWCKHNSSNCVKYTMIFASLALKL